MNKKENFSRKDILCFNKNVMFNITMEVSKTSDEAIIYVGTATKLEIKNEKN